MGKLNLKLMQGIEREEAQIQKEKQVLDTHPDKSIGKTEETRKESGGREMPSESSVKAPTGSKKEGTRKNGTKSKKKENTDKKDKQVFSFRAALSDINIWKFFCHAKSQKMEQMASDALNEYVSRHMHQLSDTERMVFEALMAREKQ